MCHSGIRPLCLPGAASEALRLQLSMDPGRAGEFRLALRDTSGRSSVFIAEFDLRSVHYEVKSSRCHEMRLAAPPHDSIRFNFRCDREAEEWATVVMSSLREAHRVANIHESLIKPSGGAAAASSSGPLLEPWNSAPLPLSEELCLELARAVEAGDVAAASQHAAALARQKAALTVRLSETNYASGEISLSVVVEDVSSSCCVTVKVFPYMTVAALKQQVFLEYGFHPRVQRWVIGRCLCTEPRSLASYGVQRDGDTAYLYLISARQARITRQLFQQDLENALLAPPLPSANGPAATAAAQDWRGYSTLPSRLPHNTQGSSGWTERAAGVKDVLDMEKLQLSEHFSKSSKPQVEWACPSCTFINKPSRPGCEICTTSRPEEPSSCSAQQDKGRREERVVVGGERGETSSGLTSSS